jgi:hypothetical protein
LLKIGAPVAFAAAYVVPAVSALMARYPEIEVELQASDRPADFYAQASIWPCGSANCPTQECRRVNWAKYVSWSLVRPRILPSTLAPHLLTTSLSH